MGAYLSQPRTTKSSGDGGGSGPRPLYFGYSAMQGWRVSMEDAHNCIPDLDSETAMFSVYDGHGGEEVALYCAKYLPEIIKDQRAYKEGKLQKALEDAFLAIDAKLTTEEVVKELSQMAGRPQHDGEEKEEKVADEDDVDNEEAALLHEEATMTIEELLTRYGQNCVKGKLGHSGGDQGPEDTREEPSVNGEAGTEELSKPHQEEEKNGKLCLESTTSTSPGPDAAGGGDASAPPRKAAEGAAPAAGEAEPSCSSASKSQRTTKSKFFEDSEEESEEAEEEEEEEEDDSEECSEDEDGYSSEAATRQLHKPLLFIDKDTRVVVQGIGNQGQFHSRLMREYGTHVVGAVHPKKAGTLIAGLPVFHDVKECVQKTDANASLIFVPASGAAQAMIEAADSGVGLIVCITEHIPQHDMIKVKKILNERGVALIGPNCPGIIQPSTHVKLGIIPTNIHTPGRIGIVSRSGTLTYEASHATTMVGLGQSTVVGIGGDPFAGQLHTDVVKRFAEDPNTEGIILIGEIGGTSEEDAADWIKKNNLTKEKPIVSFIAGATAPPGKRMGHAGAIVSGGKGTAEGKYEALQSAGVRISRHPGDLGRLIFEEMKKMGRC